jgi:hypothetical protein
VYKLPFNLTLLQFLRKIIRRACFPVLHVLVDQAEQPLSTVSAAVVSPETGYLVVIQAFK